MKKNKPDPIFDRAIKEITKEIELNPNNASAYFVRGNLKRKINKFEEVVTDWNKAEKLGFDVNNVYADIGKNEVDKQSYNEAIPYLEKAVELNSNDVELCWYLGVALFYKKGEMRGMFKVKSSEDYYQSIKILDKAIEIDPKWPHSYYQRGYAKFKLDNKNEAQKDYEIAKSLNTKTSYYIYQ